MKNAIKLLKKAVKLAEEYLTGDKDDPMEDIYQWTSDALAELTHRDELKLTANNLCDLLEHEWRQADGMPKEAAKVYREACAVLGRDPVFE
jgi:hypothetical protein